MKKYKRVTEKAEGCFQYTPKYFNRIVDGRKDYDAFTNYDAFFAYSMAIKRLGELEDAIENGTLVFLPVDEFSEELEKQ